MIKPDLLRKISYFAGLEQAGDTLAQLAKLTLEEKYEKGQLLYLEGDRCRGLYYLVEGQVRIFKSSPEGRELTLQLVSPGQTFNEVAVLDGAPVPASAEATENSLLWLIPTEIVLKLLESEPAVARAIVNDLASRMRQLTMLVGELTLKQVTARVARILLSQVEQGSILGIGISNQLTTQMTQQQMAAMAGTVREMVGRALRTLQKAGAIEARRGYIIIKDAVKLQTFL
jgi:CRP-like cAMP-binding protein